MYTIEHKIEQMIQNRTPAVMFLVNGFQLHGYVKGYDGKSVLFEEDGVENICLIHAISTLRPSGTGYPKHKD